MEWKKYISPSLHDIRICESVGITIEAIEVHGLFLVVYRDPYCNIFKKQYTESDRYILREQRPFELMMAYRTTAELVLKNNYS